jgi:hypothetical protein
MILSVSLMHKINLDWMLACVAAGARFHLNGANHGTCVAPNIGIIVVSHEGEAKTAWSALGRRLWEEQNIRLNGLQSNSASLSDAFERIKADREEYRDRFPSPAPEHIRFLDDACYRAAARLNPALLVQNPNFAELEHAIAKSPDNAPVAWFDRLSTIRITAGMVPGTSSLLRLIFHYLNGTHTGRHRGKPITGAFPSVVLECSASDYAAINNSRAMQTSGILGLLIPVWSSQFEQKFDHFDGRFGALMSDRGQLSVGIDLAPDATTLVNQEVSWLEAAAARQPLIQKSKILKWRNLLRKVVLGYAILAGESLATARSVEHALETVRNLRQLEQSIEEHTKGFLPSDSDARAAQMLRKIERLGACKFRDLARTYFRQSGGILRPILEELKRRGKVRESPQGMIELINPPAARD